MTAPVKKPRGGHRKGSGRKQNPARIAVEAAVAASSVDLDGRSVGGKDHAQWLIEQLNAIDPLLMEQLNLAVSSDPYELPADADKERRAEIEKLESRRKQLWQLRERAQRKFAKLSYELQGWAHIWFDSRTKLEARKYLHDKAGHQAVRIINHVHDKPIEHNVTMTLSERFRLALEKGEQRVRSLR